ncbi:Protein of unknown function [Gryllus bimaculatus]|nr:Protein of unknown function [Gryllus bimaculatus]
MASMSTAPAAAEQQRGVQPGAAATLCRATVNLEHLRSTRPRRSHNEAIWLSDRRSQLQPRALLPPRRAGPLHKATGLRRDSLHGPPLSTRSPVRSDAAAATPPEGTKRPTDRDSDMAKTSERAAAAWCVRLLCVLLVLAALLEAAAARGSFQKIPFNGSMFGKRAAATAGPCAVCNVRGCGGGLHRVDPARQMKLGPAPAPVTGRRLRLRSVPLRSVAAPSRRCAAPTVARRATARAALFVFFQLRK